MAKPKAPVWLRESFRDGVDEQCHVPFANPHIPYSTAHGLCWLVRHDELECSCEGKLERFHFIPRQRVEHALGALLPPQAVVTDKPFVPWPIGFWDDLILLAAWDSRNGGIACEAHHRRFDGHMMPKLTVPRDALPAHVVEFTEDWGLESQLEQRFPEYREEIAA